MYAPSFLGGVSVTSSAAILVISVLTSRRFNSISSVLPFTYLIAVKYDLGLNSLLI